MAIEFVKLLFFLLFSLVGIYLTGAIILAFVKFRLEKPYEKTFAALLTGLLAWVIIFSLAKTTFQSVHLILLFVILIYILRKGESLGRFDTVRFISYYRKEHLRSLRTVLLAAFAFWFFKSWFLYSYDSIIPKLPHFDHVLYSNISEFINKTGKESPSLDYIYYKNGGLVPYHYFDFWLNALLFNISGAISLINLELLTYPLLFSICFSGFLAALEQWKKVELKSILFLFLLLFLCGIALNQYTGMTLFDKVDIFSRNIFNYSKLTIIYIFVIVAVIAAKRENLSLFICSLTCLPIVYITTAPSVFVATGLFLILLRIRRLISWKSFLSEMFIPVSAGIFLLLFYAVIFKGDYSHFSHTGSTADFLSLGSSSAIKTDVNIIGKTILQFAGIYFLYFLILLYLYRKTKLKSLWDESRFQYLFLFLFLFPLSLLAWVLLHQNVDSVQAFSNISIVTINVILIIVLLRQNSSKFIILFVLPVVAVNVYQTYIELDINRSARYSKKFLETVDGRIANLNPVGAFIYDKSDYTDIFSKSSKFNTPGKYLMMMKKGAYLISLSIFDIPFSDDPVMKANEEKLMEATTFYKYVKNQNALDDTVKIRRLKTAFIKEFGIDYLITSRNAILDTDFAKMMSFSVSDPNSGEKFWVIKK